MSDDKNKTEQPTAHRLREARKEGQVAKSKDLTQTVLMVTMFGYMLFDADSLVKLLTEMIVLPANVVGANFEEALGLLVEAEMNRAIELTTPFLVIAFTFTLLAELGQTGLMFTLKSIEPSMKKLDMVENLKNMFSIKSVFEFGKSCFKVALLSTVLYVILRNSLPTLVRLPEGGISAVATGTGILLKTMIFWVGLGYACISILDFFWQRHQHIRSLMMTKEEVERDEKETEGDRHIKHKRKELHRELLQNDAVANTRMATAVVTNPTHLAVALLYERETTPLPVVLAKGEGALAHEMVRVARENDIPVLQNIPLARALTQHASLMEFIPSDLIEPVAELLRIVRELKDNEEKE